MCPLTLSWSLFADPSVGHRATAALPLLIHTPSSQVTVGTTSSPGTCPWFLLRMGALSQFLAGSWVSRAWGVARVAWKQQHRVDPKGPPTRARGGQKRGEPTWVATKGHLRRQRILWAPHGWGWEGPRSPSTSHLEPGLWACSSRARRPKRGCAVSQVR